MDATRSFKELTEQIENSKLNYVITKTPFSANISIRRSFIRYHFDSSVKETNEVKEETLTHPQKNEIDELKSRILGVLSENEKLQEFLKEQTAKVTNLEENLRDSREELVSVRKEMTSSA